MWVGGEKLLGKGRVSEDYSKGINLSERVLLDHATVYERMFSSR